MTPFQIKLEKLLVYQKETGSKKTYLYEVYKTENAGGSFTVILADTDEEARHSASIIVPNAKWMRMDDWGKGPRIDLK